MSTLATHDQSPYSGEPHFALGTPLVGHDPSKYQTAVFGTGCFWGAEKGFWRMPGVYSTAVGFCNGTTDNPTYKEVCNGASGHNEVVLVAWEPSKISYLDLLRQFWQCHDPTQGDRQGNDRGTQYRSGIYCTTEEQLVLAQKSLEAFQKEMKNPITTEVAMLKDFHIAEAYHQQYLARPGNRQYCSAEPTGKSLPSPSSWLSEEELAKYGQPRLLPEAYWEKHGPQYGCALGKKYHQFVWEDKKE